MKRIGIDARCLEWQRGGVVRYLIKFLQIVPLYNPESKIILYFQNSIPDEDFLKNEIFDCKIISGPDFLKTRRIVCEQILLPIQIIKDKIDVFYATWYTAPLLVLYKDVYLGAWDISFITHPNHYSLINRFSLGFFGKISCYRSKGIITCSEFDSLQIQSTLNIHSSKILTLKFPAEDKFDCDIENEKIEFALEKIGIKKPYILTLGVIYNRRNIPHLIEAFNIISKVNKNISLLVIGKDATHPFMNIKKIMEPIINKKRGLYLEYLPEDLLVPIYKGSSLFYCSSDVDGEAILLKEAMRSGVPILSSKMLEKATNSHGTYVNNPKDINELSNALEFVLKKDETIISKAKKGIKFNRNINWEDAVRDSYNFINN